MCECVDVHARVCVRVWCCVHGVGGCMRLFMIIGLRIGIIECVHVVIFDSFVSLLCLIVDVRIIICV